MHGRLKLDAALRALPEVDDLVHLRAALIGASREDGDRAWAASSAYATLDTRLADPGAVEAQVAALADRARARAEAVLRVSVRALAALEAGDAAAAARALVEAGEAEEEDGRLAEAEACYRQALALGRRPRDRSAEGLALRRLGRVARERGDLEAALRHYREGYAVAEAQRDLEGAVVACQGLGNVCVDQGMWSDARAWYERGLALLMDRPPGRALWQLYSNLSVVARRSGRLDESAAWLDRAEAVARELDDALGVLPVENGRAMLRVARGELDAAAAAYRRSLEGEGSPSLRASVLVNLAECLLLKGDLRASEAAARELERIAVAHRLAPLLPHVYRALGAVARARGDAEGFVFYEQGLDLCRDGGVPPIELAITQHEYALLEADHGLLESAAARLEEALSIYRRLGTRPEVERAQTGLAAVRARMEAGSAALTTHHDGRT